MTFLVLLLNTGCGSIGIDVPPTLLGGSSPDKEAAGDTPKDSEPPALSSPPGSGGSPTSSGGELVVGGGGAELQGDGGASAQGGEGGAPEEFVEDSSGGTGGSSDESLCQLWCDEEPSGSLFYHTYDEGFPEGGNESRNAQITLDEDMARIAGSPSLRLQAQGMRSEAEVGVNFSALSGGALLVRAWIYVPDGPMSEWVKIIGINPAVGTVSNQGQNSGIHVRIDPDGSVLVIASEGQGNSQTEPNSYPKDKWFCLQVHVWIDDEQGEIEVRVDGESVLLLSEVDTSPEVGVARIDYGIAEVGPGPQSNQIYFDSVFAREQETSCDEQVTLGN